MAFRYKWKCQNQKCQTIRESDHLAHGEKPCGKCKSKMVRMDSDERHFCDNVCDNKKEDE
jgi:hypothetical protein